MPETRTRTARRLLPALLLGCLSQLACGPTDGVEPEAKQVPVPTVDDLDPPTAQWHVVEQQRADLAAVRHAADGGGRVWLEQAAEVREGGAVAAEAVTAGSAGRWRFVYEARGEGIAVGGSLHFKVSPFWRWSQPWCAQDAGGDRSTSEASARASQRPGLTEFATDASGLELELIVSEMSALAVIKGRPLAAGEQVSIVYGAGAAGARADDFAERGAPFWFAVDADGDGVSAFVAQPARVDIAAAAPRRLVATLNSGAEPGELVRLTLAVLDAVGNAGVAFEGRVEISHVPDGWGLPEAVDFHAGDGGVQTLEFRPPEEGVFRLFLDGPGELDTLSNPLVVLKGTEPVRWADLHGHSHVSDGTGTPEDYYRYARDVSALDIVALTDHDHYGFKKLDADPETWQRIREAVRNAHEPGRFVALLGYEWTSWIHGHRHVLSFDEQLGLEVLSSADPAFETPRQLWDALEGQAALTFAHHSAGRPIATNWSFRPDPHMEPVTEIVSVHGSSEAMDSPYRIGGPLDGNFVRDVLDQGMRFGFIGSGDSHDGHPGLPQFSNPSGVGGLAGVITRELSRESVLGAMRERRVYATTGARIILRCSMDGARMGSTMLADGAEGVLSLLVYGTAPIRSLELVRSGGVVDTWVPDSEGVFDLGHSWSLSDLKAGEYVYVRVLQEDGHMAWTSPFYLD